MNQGRLWTTTHQLLWFVLGELHHHSRFWRGWLKIKPAQDKFKWPRTPWERDDDGTRYGKVAEVDRPAAAKYLIGLYRPPADS